MVEVGVDVIVNVNVTVGENVAVSDEVEVSVTVGVFDGGGVTVMVGVHDEVGLNANVAVPIVVAVSVKVNALVDGAAGELVFELFLQETWADIIKITPKIKAMILRMMFLQSGYP